MPTICIFRIFSIGDLRSGQFLYLSITYKSMGEKPNPFYTHQAGGFTINWVKLGYWWWSKCKFWSVTFIEVTWVHWGHQQGFANNSRLKRARDMGVVALCLSCHGASIDMQRDLFGQYVTWWSNVDLTWCQILTWLFKVTVYIYQRALTRGTQWCPNYSASFLTSTVICQKCHKQLFWSFLTSRA